MNIVKIYEMFPTEADCVAHLEKVVRVNRSAPTAT